MSRCRIGSPTLWCVAAEIVGGTPCYVARNLFVAKQVNSKHYGLKLWGANFWSDSLCFYLKESKNHPKEVRKFRNMLFLEKRPLPGMHHTEVRSGDGHQNPNIQISRYPDIQMSRCPDVRISRYQVSDTRYQVSEKTSENYRK